MALFRTITNTDYSALDDRVWAHPGAIVDLGCYGWDWSAVFFGRKRVIGADPYAFTARGAELFRGVLGPRNGEAFITCQGDGSNVLNGAGKAMLTPMLSWKTFAQRYDLDLQGIAALKMNIEGSEYALIASMTDAELLAIDQLVVSFHHDTWPALARATEETIARLQKIGFFLTQINKSWCWYLCLKL